MNKEYGDAINLNKHLSNLDPMQKNRKISDNVKSTGLV